MTIPLLALLAFATWTLVVLMTTVGVHRWTLILMRRAAINDFPADGSNGPDWYQRATRAHANCVENLPVFGAIVAVATWSGAEGLLLDVPSVAIVGARLCQTTTHVAFKQTARAVSFRFGFFSVQLVGMLWMIAVIIRWMAAG